MILRLPRKKLSNVGFNLFWFVASFSHDEGEVVLILYFKYFLLYVAAEVIEVVLQLFGQELNHIYGDVFFIEDLFDLFPQTVENLLDLQIHGCLSNVDLLSLFANIEIILQIFILLHKISEIIDFLCRLSCFLFFLFCLNRLLQ